MEIHNSDTLNTIIMIQENKIYYIINWLQIEKFVFTNNWDIDIFSIEYYWVKKVSVNLIYHKSLIENQIRE